MKKGPIIILLIFLSITFALSGQTGQIRALLISNDFAGLDNSLELTVDKEGRISFIKADYYEGPGIKKQYSLDVVKEPYELHDIGVSTDKDIIPVGSMQYRINSASKVPLMVEITERSIKLSIGLELFVITRPQATYTIETGPKSKDDKIEATNKTVFEVARNRKIGFLGFKQQRWFPDQENSAESIDFVAKDCPEQFSLIGQSLEASTYDPTSKQSTYWYSYTIPLAKSRDINLMNYLILLTQRCDEGDPSYPVIHPVLLTLYYYDALMAAN